MAGMRAIGSLLVVMMIAAPSAANAQAVKVDSGKRGVNDAMASTQVNLASLPQITPQVAATHLAAPPFGTGTTWAEYAARKAAAGAQSQALRNGRQKSAVPASPNATGVETPTVAAFGALKFGCAGTDLVPPDQGLAVNQSYVLEMVNACIAVYDKAGHLQPGFPKSLNAFFGRSPSALIFDPRAIYDWANNRFIAIATMAGDLIKPRIFVAVSQSSNPLGTWKLYILPGPGDTQVGDISDFPELGQDRSAVYLTFNRFDSVENFLGAEIIILPKAKMYAGVNFTYVFWTGMKEGGQLVDTIQPANEFSPSDHPRAEFLINSRNINFGGSQCSSSTCNGLVVWALSNPLEIGGSSELSGVFVPTANDYSLPPPATQPSAIQPACTSGGCIDTGDVRISGGVTYHAGSLFGSLNTASQRALGSHVLWFEVKPALSDIGSNGCNTERCPDITSARIVNEDCFMCTVAGNWYYATLQPDLENNVEMVVHYSDASSYPSVLVTSRRATLDPNMMHDSGTYLIAPVASYNSPIGETPPFRWGDYTATAPDLTSANSQVWFAGEFSNAAGVWRTAIGHLSFNKIVDP